MIHLWRFECVSIWTDQWHSHRVPKNVLASYTRFTIEICNLTTLHHRIPNLLFDKTNNVLKNVPLSAVYPCRGPCRLSKTPRISRRCGRPTRQNRPSLETTVEMIGLNVGLGRLTNHPQNLGCHVVSPSATRRSRTLLPSDADAIIEFVTGSPHCIRHQLVLMEWVTISFALFKIHLPPH